MSESSDAPAERLAALLAAYHEQLIDFEAPRVEATDLSGEELSHFERLRDCLLHLEQVRTAEVLNGAVAGAKPSSDSGAGSQLADPGVRRIGRFEILRELGRGGLGIVLLAQDHLLKRRVALKVPRPEVLVTAEVRDRFDREAQAAARLTHPHIVPVYEVGQAGPINFIVSGYCEGPNLAEWLQAGGGPLSARHSAQMIAMLADAIDYAHGQGVLHRDIKPSNILLEPIRPGDHSSDGLLPFVPKLVDFGLARLDKAPSRHTRAGIAMGTWGYMAPEQAEGRTADVGAATDVHALGAVLYECLTGRVPYEGKSDADCLRRIVSEEPRQPAHWNPQVPRDLAAICLKCLEKAPAKRYASAGELAADLRRFLGGEPTVARPLSPFGRTWRWARRRPAVAALLAVSLVSVLAVAAGSVFYNVRLNQALAVSEDLRGQAEANARIARENEARVRQHTYVADMRVAQQMRHDGDFSSLAGVLDRYEHDGQRGFEWRYLSRFRDAVCLKFQAHEDDIDRLEFSAGGDVLATTCVKEGTVRIWEIPSGRSLGSFNVRTSTPRRWQEDLSALSPDGRRIAVLTDRQTMVVYDAESSAELTRFNHSQPIHTVRFLGDSGQVVLGAADESLVWEYKTGAVSQRYPASRLAAVSADGRQLAMAAATPWSSVLQLFNVPPSASVREFAQAGTVRSISYSADGTMVAVLSDTRPWSVISVRNPYTSQPISGAGGLQGERYNQIGFSSDDRWLVATATDGRLKFWNARTGSPGRSLRGPAARLTQFAFSADQRWLATAVAGGAVLVWDQRLLAPCAELTPESEVTGPLRISSDGKTLAVATPDLAVLLIDLPSMRVRLRLAKHVQKALDLAFSPDGTRLVSTDGDFVYCWSCQVGKRLWATPVAFANCVDWSPRHNFIAWAGGNHIIALLSAEDGTDLPAAYGQPADISGLRFLPDGERLVSASIDGTIRLWDAVKDEAIGEPLNTGMPLYQVAVSADGKLIAAAGISNRSRISVWRLNDDNLLEDMGIDRPWEGVPPSSFAFSPDGETLGVGGATGVFRAIDLKTGDIRYTLGGRRVAASSVAFCPEGYGLVAVSPEGSLTLWDLSRWQTRTLDGSPLSAVRSLAFLHGGSTLAIGTDDSVDADRPIEGNSNDEPSIKGLAKAALAIDSAAPDERVDARPWDSSGPGFRLWDVANGREKPVSGQCVSAAAIPLVAASCTGLVATGSRDGTVWIWNSDGRRLVTRFAVNSDSESVISWSPQAGQPIPRATIKTLDGIVALAFSVDGTKLGVATRRGIVQVVNTDTWEHRTTLCSDAEAVACLAFAPSGSLLVANRGGQLLCWNLAAGPKFDVQKVGATSDSRISSAAFSHSGRLFAIGREDGVVEIFDGHFPIGVDAFTEARRHVLRGHLDRVTSLSFSGDDRTLASGSWDTTVRLWHTASQQELAVLNAHRGKIEAVAFSPDGNTLATGGQRDADHGEVLLWRADASH